MSAFVPAFVSEFPDQPVTDCVPAVALMVTNKVTHNRYPASQAQREAVQNAMGTQDQGATNEQAVAGVRKLTGVSLGTVSGWEAIAHQLTQSNIGLGIIGKYPELPSVVRVHGRQPSFNGLHDIYAQGTVAGYAIIGDPLGSSMGPEVAIGSLEAFARSTGYAALVGVEQAAQLVGYRVVTNMGPLTSWRVMRWSHILYSPVTHSFRAGSWAPVKHGLPGYWLVTDGPMTGRYLVHGRSQVFNIRALYSDGSSRAVPASA